MFKKCPQGNRHSGRPAKGVAPAFPSDATTVEAMTVTAETSEDYQEHPGHRKNSPKKQSALVFAVVDCFLLTPVVVCARKKGVETTDQRSKTFGQAIPKSEGQKGDVATSYVTT